MALDELPLGKPIPIEEALPWMNQPERIRREEAQALYSVLIGRYRGSGHEVNAKNFVNKIYSSDYSFEQF